MVSDEDKKLFAEAVKGARAIKKKDKYLAPKKRLIAKRRLPLYDPLPEPDLSDAITEHLGANEEVRFKQATLSNHRMQALSQNKTPPKACLDLHGLSVLQAKTVLVPFIQTHSLKRNKIVKIIHGKGARFNAPPVLKNHATHWLKQMPQVLAFCSARPKDGGTGALYVLLKPGKE